MPFVDPAEMMNGSPLTGWTGRFFHSENMTFAHWEIAPDAAPHSVRPVGRCRVVVADYPLRLQLPGVANAPDADA
jgi:hypothetical protein